MPKDKNDQITIQKWAELCREAPFKAEATLAKCVLGRNITIGKSKDQYYYKAGDKAHKVAHYIRNEQSLMTLINEVSAKDGPWKGEMTVTIVIRGDHFEKTPKYHCRVDYLDKNREMTYVMQDGAKSLNGVVGAALLRAVGRISDE